MTGAVRWTAAAIAAAVIAGAGALIAQDAIKRGVGDPTLWTTSWAGALWLVAAALLAACVLTRNTTRSVLLAVLSVAWVAPMFAWWADDGNALAVSVAPAVSFLAVPALWHLLLAATAVRSAVRAVALVAVWALTAAPVAVLVLLRDPFLDAGCQGVCSPNPILLFPVPQLVALAHLVLAALTVGVGAAALVWAIAFLTRRRAWLALAPVPALLGIAMMTLAGALAPPDSASSRPPAEGFLAAGLSLVAITALSGGIAAASRRAALRRLADDLVAGDGSRSPDLRSRLVEVLDDASVEVLFPLDDGRWVDSRGTARALPATAGLTPVRRQGVTVAMVVGPPEAPPDLEAIGAAAGLAIDNERLRAGISARLAELRESRVHVVEAGDDERRRIERNLHDGMQQSLLVLQYELALLASQDDDPGRQAALARLRVEAHRITERLRDLARGVFPAALDDLGVAAALQRLADDAPFPLELSGRAEPRPPRPIERTLYLVADEALAGGVAAPGALRIAVDRTPDAVSVRTANSRAAASSTLRDRIMALGGRVDAHEGGVEVTLPCASS